jgi:predicted ATP-dependent endonuclease of OLD family
LTITQDEFDKSSVMAQLSGADNIWSIITESYDIFDPLFWNFHQTGQWITDGTSQIYNFFFSIFSDHRKDLVVMIDSIERNLHVLVLRKIIRDITGLKKVKKLIVVTHSPEVVGEWWDNTYDIKKIVDIYADKC